LPQRSAPALGADTESVLGELGYDEAGLAALRAAGAI
jgi:crotonobetainyl-CoA:carnitine CoA-transferase CaiB-like acyl-CoA transferase